MFEVESPAAEFMEGKISIEDSVDVISASVAKNYSCNFSLMESG